MKRVRGGLGAVRKGGLGGFTDLKEYKDLHSFRGSRRLGCKGLGLLMLAAGAASMSRGNIERLRRVALVLRSPPPHHACHLGDVQPSFIPCKPYNHVNPRNSLEALNPARPSKGHRIKRRAARSFRVKKKEQDVPMSAQQSVRKLATGVKSMRLFQTASQQGMYQNGCLDWEATGPLGEAHLA